MKQAILPTFDIKADTLDKIYLKESIISKKEIDTINYKAVYKQIKSNEQIPHNEHSQFVV